VEVSGFWNPECAAVDRDAAVRWAGSCPHARGGGQSRGIPVGSGIDGLEGPCQPPGWREHRGSSACPRIIPDLSAPPIGTVATTAPLRVKSVLVMSMMTDWIIWTSVGSGGVCGEMLRRTKQRLMARPECQTVEPAVHSRSLSSADDEGDEGAPVWSWTTCGCGLAVRLSEGCRCDFPRPSCPQYVVGACSGCPKFDLKISQRCSRLAPVSAR
jgi:hypothetical protein